MCTVIYKGSVRGTGFIIRGVTKYKILLGLYILILRICLSLIKVKKPTSRYQKLLKQKRCAWIHFNVQLFIDTNICNNL